MFEYCASNNCNYDLFNRLCLSLKSKLKPYNPFVVRHNFDKKYSICVAIDEKYAKIGRAIIEESIVSYIIFDYKKYYLKKQICKHRLGKNYLCNLINALVHFESNVDRQIVVQNLPSNSNEIVINSFIAFKLKELINRWNDIAGIIVNNLEMLISQKSYEELIEYFAQNNISEICVYLYSKNIKICSKNQENDLIFGYSQEDLQNFVVEIISLGPEKIIVFECEKQFDFIAKILPQYLLDKTATAKLK